MSRLRIILADDHALVRAGIRVLLETMPGIEVVGEAGDGIESLEIIRKLMPDVALIDLSMPKLGGISVAEQVASQFPKVRVIMLSMHRHAACVTDALRAGAIGYLVKDAASSELHAAIRTVEQGNSYVSPAICHAVITASLRSKISNSLAEKNTITSRQWQVLRLIAEGQNTKEIGYTLGISPKTVEVHRMQLMERLGIYDVPGLVRYAMRTGVVSPEPYSENFGTSLQPALHREKKRISQASQSKPVKSGERRKISSFSVANQRLKISPTKRGVSNCFRNRRLRTAS